MLRTVGKNGLNLGLVALLQLDNGPSSKGGEHDGAMFPSAHLGFCLSLCDVASRIGA